MQSEIAAALMRGCMRVQVSALKNQLAQVQAERDSLQKQLLMAEPASGPPEQSLPSSAQPTPRSAT